MAKLSKHFTEAEMACRCGRTDCDAAPMRARFIFKLECLRAEWGKPLKPVSGARCPKHNAEVGGAPKSQHLYGNAVDFHIDPKEVPLFVALGEKYGFNGIGFGKKLVHLDDRDYPARWTYD